jgi:hypothetical protein
VFTILLLPILHLRLLPIHLPLRISYLFFTSHKTFKTTLSMQQFKHLDSSNVVNLEQIIGNKHAVCTLFPLILCTLKLFYLLLCSMDLKFSGDINISQFQCRQAIKKVGLNKIDKFFKDPFKGRDDVRRRLRALSCEKSSNIADPQDPTVSKALIFILHRDLVGI